jgi:hypothetical protein
MERIAYLLLPDFCSTTTLLLAGSDFILLSGDSDLAQPHSTSIDAITAMISKLLVFLILDLPNLYSDCER